jgi:hypothetical protein
MAVTASLFIVSSHYAVSIRIACRESMFHRPANRRPHLFDVLLIARPAIMMPDLFDKIEILFFAPSGDHKHRRPVTHTTFQTLVARKKLQRCRNLIMQSGLVHSVIAAIDLADLVPTQTAQKSGILILQEQTGRDIIKHRIKTRLGSCDPCAITVPCLECFRIGKMLIDVVSCLDKLVLRLKTFSDPVIEPLFFHLLGPDLINERFVFKTIKGIGNFVGV